MMEGPDEVYVTTGEVAPPEDTGEEGQECTTGKEDISGQESSTRKEDPEEYQLMGDIAYIEEDTTS